MSHIFIYTDFIEDQIYGGDKLPLLHTVYLNSEAKTNTIIDTPGYVTVNRNTLSTINITLKSFDNTLVKFTNKTAKVILKLHFRPKQE